VHLLVVNCNTSREMTETLAAVAGAASRPGTSVQAVGPEWGVTSAEGFYDSFISAAAVLDLLRTWQGAVDGVVMAGYGEHGREGARQLLDVPVVDITEAAAMFACLVGLGFGVVTTTRTSVPQVWQSLRTAGLADRCVGVRAMGVRVLDLDTDPEAVLGRFVAEARQLMESGAETVVAGCAGLARFRAELEERLGVPVVDGVAAAVSLCEDLVHHGLRTSKAGAFAPPDLSKTSMPAATAVPPEPATASWVRVGQVAR